MSTIFEIKYHENGEEISKNILMTDEEYEKHFPIEYEISDYYDGLITEALKQYTRGPGGVFSLEEEWQKVYEFAVDHIKKSQKEQLSRY